MGFIDTAPGTDLPVFYNVVHAVGEGCPNQKDDVMLVQYLLMSVYEKLPSSARPKGDIGVTGYCGGATRNWILKFQLDANKACPGATAADGRVDRIREKSLIGTMSKMTYTLAILNANAIYYNPEKFTKLPQLVPLQNPAEVPPPSADTFVTITASGKIIIHPSGPMLIPESGGF
jgi:hypothetical protein